MLPLICAWLGGLDSSSLWGLRIDASNGRRPGKAGFKHYLVRGLASLSLN